MTTPALSADAPRLVRHLDKSTGVPQARFTTHVLGERQIRTYTAMCQQAGRRPYELAGDILLAAISTAQRDPDLQQTVADLSTVLDTDHDGPACRMCGCTENAACIGGCHWVPDPLLLGDLCSSCQLFVDHPVDVDEEDAQEVSEADAIAALLARLPEADAGELVVLARTCPEYGVHALLPHVRSVLDELRDRLIEVVTQAHHEAVLAEEWIASLEAVTEAETTAESAA